MPKTEDSTHTPIPWRVERPEDGLLRMGGSQCALRQLASHPPLPQTILIWVPLAMGPGSDLGAYHAIAEVDVGADAAFIVRAVNNHATLLAALEGCCSRIGDKWHRLGCLAFSRLYGECDYACVQAHAAIAAARQS